MRRRRVNPAAILTLVALCAAVPRGADAQVTINEVLASNRATIVDEDGDTPDLLELYNAGTSDVALDAYGLSDDEAEPHKWVLPTVSLAPKAYLIIWCSGKDRADPDKELHASFKLTSDGEKVLLSDAQSAVVDELEFPAQTPDRSYGRFPDGAAGFYYMLFPTPGAANDSYTSSESIPESLLEFSPESGKQSEPIDVEIAPAVSWEGFEIRYTLDGSAAVVDSPLYERPIPVTEDTVIHAVGVLDGRVVTGVVSKSYFGLSQFSRRLGLPTMFVSMALADFEFVHLSNGQRGRQFERPGQLEIFSADGASEVATGFGLRLHGASDEGEFEDKKAYRAYFRGEYGNTKLRYRMIPDTEIDAFDILVLRSNWHDSFRVPNAGAFIRDQVLRDLHGDMGGIVSHGAFYNLFVNMEYRGIYNVAERVEEEFFAHYLPDEGDEWDVIKTGNAIQDGDDVAWNQLKELVIGNNLRDPSLYEEVEERIDIDYFVSYMIVNIWAQNHDWLFNNWYAARPRRPDGKWIFVIWDGEVAMGTRLPEGGQSFAEDTFEWAHSCEQVRFVWCGNGGAPISDMFRSILANHGFQRIFLEEFDRHVAGVLSTENVLEHVDRQAEAIAPDIPEDAGRHRANRSLWENHISFMRRFAEERTPIIRQLIVDSDMMTLPIATTATPSEIALGGGPMMITLEGVRFTESTEVFFSETAASNVEAISATELRVTVPFDPTLEGSPDITLVDPDGGSWTSQGLLQVTVAPFEEFRRGDADGNGRLTVTDAVRSLQYLFGLDTRPICEDAIDTDDNGGANLTDAVYLLGYLLRSESPAPPPPLSACGPDPTEDGLECVGPTSCE